jgi:uncharacterized protein (TIGR00369 family)
MTEDLVAALNANMGELGTTMGIRITEAGPERVVATMPVEGNRQPYGLLHGGASAVLVETLGSIAAALHGGAGTYPVGIDLSCTHHRAAREGTITAVATPLSAGRTVATYDVRVTDDEGRAVCTGRLTCLIRSAPPGPPTA